MPSGAKARARANIAALRLSQQLEAEGRPATPDEQTTLAAWSSWGACQEVFDEAREDWAAERAELRTLLDEREWRAARLTTLNAHYTDPRIVTALWAALRTAGFEQGQVLEPGCGVGTFIGLAPEGARMTGVELDPATARIAAQLYPAADIRAESYADSAIPEGYFDAAIGNVPFSEHKLLDSMYNPNRAYPMHDHFILKSLAHTRPGGYVAVVVSAWTMDKQNPAARNHMSALADLVGAARLPAGTHARTAGTDVMTDVLIFRRRPSGQPAAGYNFDRVIAVDLPGADEPVRMNEVFAERPELVLGEMRAGRDRFGKPALITRADETVFARLDATLTAEMQQAKTEALTFDPGDVEKTPVALLPAGMQHAEGLIERDGDDFTMIEAGARVPFPCPKTQAGELRSLIELRDTYLRLISMEAADRDDTPAMSAARDQLNATYDAHVATYGPINAVRWSDTGKLDEDGEPILRPRQRQMGGFRKDPYSGVVLGLEKWDSETETATKADIFAGRLIVPREQRLGADTPEDALAICLDTRGQVDADEIARLLGRNDPDAIIDGLEDAGLIFRDPTDGPVTTAEYLSGQVRAKLRAAAAAAEDDPRYARNVAALEAVQPVDLTPEQIEVQLGGWIGHDDVQQFIREISDDRNATVTHPGGQNWRVKGMQYGVLARETWGTEDYPLPRLAESLLNRDQIKVMDRSGDKPIVDVTKTEATVAKGAELQERFNEWAWEDPERARRLAAEYNDRFNGIVVRQYDGAHLTLPGMSQTAPPLRSHQRAAIARMISEPSVGLFHVVGAGKTLEMAAGVMELRRLGMVNKPAICVPNHLVAQFVREWQQAYPAAKVLAAGMENLGRTPADRQRFLGIVTANDWDAVIFSREAFKRVPLSAENANAYIEAETEQLERWVEAAKEQGDLKTVKSMEKRLLGQVETLKAKLAGAKDSGLTFEQTGIDYITVDEAHDYKNLRTPSSNSDLAIAGSQRADDMLMKISYLRAKHGSRVACFATGTPVANSLTELHVMQRYLRPDLLEAAGLDTFDTWAATFTKEVTAPEIKPTGGGFRVKTRIAKFHNVPELMRMFHTFGDVKQASDLNLPRPDVAGGRTVPVLVPASAELETIAKDAAERADRGGADPENNLLAIMTRLRHAALDVRTLGAATSDPQKVDVAADNIARIWAETKDTPYSNGDRPGALQIVFSDLSVPKQDQWNVYDELRNQLVTRGMPAASIAYIHDAKTDDEKAALFARCRSGDVAVLIGSTVRMGTGTNVQERAIALHHLDPSWRPADIEQREGRIIRQGNLNPEVQLYAYTTEGSMDAYMWGTVTRKATFIGQIMRGNLDVREVEDLSEEALSAGQITAITSGEPLLLERAELDAEAQRLTRLERAHQRSQSRLDATIRQHEQALPFLAREEEALTAALAQRTDTRGDAFALTSGRTRYDSRREAGEHLADAARQHIANDLRWQSQADPRPIGRIGGHDVEMQARKDGPKVELTYRFPAIPDAEFRINAESIGDGQGIVTRLENRLTSIETTLSENQRNQAAMRKDTDQARAQLGAPFKDAARLSQVQHRLAEVNKELVEKTKPETEPETEPPRDEVRERPLKDWESSELLSHQNRFDRALRSDTLRADVRERYEHIRAQIADEFAMRRAERASAPDAPQENLPQQERDIER